MLEVPVFVEVGFVGGVVDAEGAGEEVVAGAVFEFEVIGSVLETGEEAVGVSSVLAVLLKASGNDFCQKIKIRPIIPARIAMLIISQAFLIKLVSGWLPSVIV